jgi:hypothetical protein
MSQIWLKSLDDNRGNLHEDLVRFMVAGDIMSAQKRSHHVILYQAVRMARRYKY